MTINIEAIARVSHEAHRAWCMATGDYSHVGWDDAPEWQRSACIAGVEFVLANPAFTEREQHAQWSEEKRLEGWVYGPERNSDRKTHPCLVEFEKMPAESLKKNRLFRTIVLALSQTP
jgi:hypothetical protein